MAITLSNSQLDTLISQFVNIYGKTESTGLDLFLHPTPWFMPLDKASSKKEAAKFFLLAASLSDSELTGNPRNIRIMLDHLHSAFEEKLYTINNPSEFSFEISKCESNLRNLDKLGPKKSEIPEVLSSVNKFVDQKAHGDLIEYASKLARAGKKPEDIVKELSSGIKRMDQHHNAKAWLYMRWMVRPSPDLELFEFDAKDLKVSLTTPKLRVSAALDLLDDEDLSLELNKRVRPTSWWHNPAEYNKQQDALTNYAKNLFPDDPAKVDFPFFVLGIWLEDSDLTATNLEKALKFFINKHHELQTAPIRYLTAVPHYTLGNSSYELGAFGSFEKSVYEFLKIKQAKFDYEFLEFHLPEKSKTTGENLTYRPDFLLPQITDQGRKILLEPHGVNTGLEEFLSKLSSFRKFYGAHFSLILIVPNQNIDTIQKIDPDHQAYDALWKQSTCKGEFEKLRST